MNRKPKKNRKFRGSKTHGYGSMKKHRGAGSRGGRGMAGTGKKGDVKKPSINPKTYFGRRGFHSKSISKEKTINVSALANVVEKGKTAVNLTEKGYTRLLGAGSIRQALQITVAKASARAEKKIKAAGGSIISEAVKGNKQGEEEDSASS